MALCNQEHKQHSLNATVWQVSQRHGWEQSERCTAWIWMHSQASQNSHTMCKIGIIRPEWKVVEDDVENLHVCTQTLWGGRPQLPWGLCICNPVGLYGVANHILPLGLLMVHPGHSNRALWDGGQHISIKTSRGALRLDPMGWEPRIPIMTPIKNLI